MNTMTGGQGGRANDKRRAWLQVLLGTAAILLVPLLAMQFTQEVRWSGADFAVAAVLLLGAGFLLQWLLRTLAGRARLAALGLLALAFAAIWAELAVGVFFHLGS